ncbi:hypothetical protein Tco_0449814 [Tanacetum coccineum]
MGEGEQQTQVIRKKRDDEFTEAENIKELADIQAINILSQGLPRHIFNTLNQTETAQEIWENIELLMQGSGLTEQQQKEILFDQYERFRANGKESIHDYFVRFHKLINDMKITKIQILAHQRNTKFLNNLPSYWINTSPSVPPQSPHSTNDAMLAAMNQIVNLLRHIAKECKEKKREKDSQWFKDKAMLMEAKEKGAILDAETKHLMRLQHSWPSEWYITRSGTELTLDFHSVEQLDSDVDSDIDDYDNIIPYHQYQSNTEVKNVPTEVESNKSLKTESEKLKTDNKAREDSYQEELVWLRHANKVVTELLQSYGQPIQTIPMLLIWTKFCFQGLAPKTSLVVPPPFLLLCSTPDNVDAYNVEPFPIAIRNKPDLEREVCFQKVCNNLNSPELNIFFEINKLKEQLQGKDNTIGMLKAQINNMKDVSTGPSLSTLEIENTKLKEELNAVRIKNDSLRDENVSIKERFQELYKSKAGSNSSLSSGATILVKPKAVASGLYDMTSKYVPPQKRINRETNSSLPRKETVTVVDLSNVPVNLPTG